MTRTFRPLLVAAALAASLAGCAPNLCQRKASYFDKCRGTDLTYSEPTCESNLEKCSAAEKAQLEAYVKCLEMQSECSMEAKAVCEAQHPGGVNLLCQGK